MPSAVQSLYTPEQIKVWLRGLLTIAWADGHFDEEEKNLITAITQDELAPSLDFFDALQSVTPEELATTLGPNSAAAENFLRMAVMVALADGVYSTEEDEKLHSFCTVLELDATILESVRSTLYNLKADSDPNLPGPKDDHGLEPLKPVREWLDQLEVHDPRLARFMCKLIPSQCPFERDVTLFGRKIVHIPPMCKLNPLYEQLVGLRFRALSYLADDYGEDVTPYL
ncbi:Mo-dependent nitrogenase C-terminal domain-containing protein [Leptolyngbya sp. PCC 6406]|uniref:Mo-dependent nitrogenase C-terminal domain-containing protein n=1 Tax=Leptolyngbya sp. PCC 6406 TaxID=1173264 RepID=UPI0002AC700B|nr:Mo-dependent nitrogenase C-terminal domain-containing protein [Leptolyngbya sp. PCC 6406]